MNEKMRAFELNGKRRGIRLDDATWCAIDWLAAKRDVKWPILAREWVAEGADDESLTRTIRNAAINALMVETVFGEQRAEDMKAMSGHTLMKNSGQLDDDQLREVLKNATVQGESDFGGFVVLFGQDEFGQDCVWIKNGLRDGDHFAIAVSPEVRK